MKTENFVFKQKSILSHTGITVWWSVETAGQGIPKKKKKEEEKNIYTIK